MISQTFKSIRTKPRYTSYPYQHQQQNTSVVPITQPGSHYDAQIAIRAVAIGISAAEYHRRIAIVENLYRSCPFRIGDTFYPHDKLGLEKYGECRVLNICPTYRNMDTDVWDNDYPRIVHAVTVKDNNMQFWCTVGFMQRNPPLDFVQQEVTNAT